MYSKTLLRLSICLAVLLGAPVAAMAATVTFGFTGVVTAVNAPLAAEFSVGEPVVGNYTFESTTADLDPGDPTLGDYDNAITAFTATFGGDYTVTRGFDNDIFVSNGPTINDVYCIYLNDPMAPTAAGLDIIALIIQLIDTDSTVFASDSLPLTPPDLSEFEASLTATIFYDEPGNQWIDFQLTSLTLIPEPGTITLLLCGLASLALLRRRR